MNEKDHIEGNRILLKEFLWDLAEQWRGLLLSGLIFAVLISGLKYGMDYSAYKNYTTQEFSGSSNVVPAMVAPMQTQYMKTLQAYQALENEKKYTEQSILMKVDPENETRLKLTYCVRIEDAEKTELGVALANYTDLTYDAALLGQIREAFGIEGDDAVIRELFWVTIPADTQQAAIPKKTSGIFYVTVVLRSEDEAPVYEKLMTDRITELAGDFSRTAGGFSVSLMSSMSFTARSAERATFQKNHYDQLSILNFDYTGQYNKLTADERAAVDEIIQDTDVAAYIENVRNGKESIPVQMLRIVLPEGVTASAYAQDSAAGAVNSYAGPPAVKAVTILISFMIGVLAYALLCFYRAVFTKNLNNERSVKEATGLRLFGGIYEYPYKSFLQRLLHDKNIYRLRHRISGDAREGAKRVTEAVAARASHEGVPSVSFIVLGSVSAWGRAVLSGQKTGLMNAGGVASELLYLDNGAYSINEKAFSEIKSAVLVFVSKTTTFEMAAEVMNRAREYGIVILGTEFLEAV